MGKASGLMSNPPFSMLDLDTMPKAELHLHLEGAPRWSTLRSAHFQHYGVELPKTPPWYASDFRFANFSAFQALFKQYIHPWLQTPNGYAELIQDVIDTLVEQNIRYAEVVCVPALVERHGASLEHFWDTLEAEIERARLQKCIIRVFVGLMRTHSIEDAIYWVQQTRMRASVAGFDLLGDEVGYPAEPFRPALELGKEAGKRLKIHAGEMTGPESIQFAVETLGITQIGHGTSAIRNPEVVALLRERQVTLEMCPTSNERLKNISSYEDHPLLALDELGVLVTVNSDDPTFFGVNLSSELSRLIAERQVSIKHLKRWTQNALRQAIIDESTRSNLMAELEAWCPIEGDQLLEYV